MKNGRLTALSSRPHRLGPRGDGHCSGSRQGGGSAQPVEGVPTARHRGSLRASRWDQGEDAGFQV